MIKSQNALPTTNLQDLRTNASLQKDEWEQIDEEAVRISQKVRTVMSDIMDAGLSVDAGGLGTLEWTYDALEGFDTEAAIDAEVVTAKQNDDVVYHPITTPIPMIGQTFELNARRLEASRTNGRALDTTGVAECARLVNNKAEDLIVNGTSQNFNGNSIEGFTNHSDKLSVTLDNDWVSSGEINSSATPKSDVLEMVDALYQKGLTGPYHLYYPLHYDQVMRDDYKSESERTFRERLLDIEGVENLSGTAALADNTVVLVQMDSSTIELAMAEDITNIEWSREGGMVTEYMTMMAFAPIVKTRYDEDGNAFAGVVELS